MKNKALFDEAKYDLDDFKSYTPLTLDVFTRGGKLYGLPHLAGIPLNWYRTDLLDEAGLNPPKNLEEFYEVGKKLNKDTNGDGKIDIYGVGLSASRTAILDEWLSFFFSYGGSLPNKPEQFTKTTIDNPTGLKTLKMYKKLFDECAPMESMTWEFGEAGSAIQRGIVAMNWNWSNGGCWYDDPQSSKVVGKVRANVPWPGRFGVNALCIPKDSKNKEAAFKFVTWATSKEMARRIVSEGNDATPCRRSVLMDSELRATRWWFQPLVEAAKQARMYLEIPEWSTMDDAISIEFQKVLTNELSPEQALKRANENAYKVLVEAGYIK
jgi:multiple sugar transport system substrate-binding protein